MNNEKSLIITILIKRKVLKVTKKIRKVQISKEKINKRKAKKRKTNKIKTKKKHR